MDTQRKLQIAAWALEAIGVGEHEGAAYYYVLGGSLALHHHGLTYRDPDDIDLFTESLTAGVDAADRLARAMAQRGLHLEVLGQGGPNDSNILARITDPALPPHAQHVQIQLVPIGDGMVEHVDGLGPLAPLRSLVSAKVQFLVDRRATKDFLDLACILAAAEHDPAVAAAVQEALEDESPPLLLAALHDFAAHSDTRVLAASGLAGALVTDARTRIADAADRVAGGATFPLHATRALATGEQPLSVQQAAAAFERINEHLPFSVLSDGEAASFQTGAWRAANEAQRAARAQGHAATVLARSFQQHGGEVAQMLRENGQPAAVIDRAILAARVELTRANRRLLELTDAEQEATAEAHAITAELARRHALDSDERASEITVRRILSGHREAGTRPNREAIIAQAAQVSLRELGELPPARQPAPPLDELVAVATAAATLSAMADAVAEAEAYEAARREQAETLAIDQARRADPELAAAADAVMIARMDAADPGWREQLLTDAAAQLARHRAERADIDLITGAVLFDAADADLDAARARLDALPAPDTRPRAEQDAILLRWAQAVHGALADPSPGSSPPAAGSGAAEVTPWRQRPHGALSDEMLAEAAAYNLHIARDAEQAATAGRQVARDDAAITAAARALNPVLAVAHDVLSPSPTVDAQWGALLDQVRAAAAEQAASPVPDELTERARQARAAAAGYQAEIELRRGLDPEQATTEKVERTLEAAIAGRQTPATPEPALHGYYPVRAAELPPDDPSLPGP